MHHRNCAGGIVVNGNKICLVLQPGKTWCFPKGGIEKGETEEEAARREIREETGLKNLESAGKLGAVERSSFTDPSKTLTIHLFLFTTKQTRLDPEEHDHKAAWFDVEEALDTLTSDAEADFLRLNRERFE